ncbi:MAG: serine hydrolase domain-containing protein, partial [Sphingomonadaceae bacterium]
TGRARQPLPPALAADVATGYPHRGASARPFETVGLPPAGALSTTGADLARFMIAHLDEGGPLLKPQTAALMQQTASRPLPPLAGMALGFFVLREEKPRILEHGGATGVARASLWLFPETRTGIAILTNSPGKSEAAVRLFQALLQGFLARWHPEANAMPPVTAGSAASAVAGRYLPTRRSGRGIARAFGFSQAVSITASADGALRTSRPTAPDGEPMIFRPVADGLWQNPESGRRLAARLEGGRVALVGIEPAASAILLEPAAWWRDPAWLQPALNLALLFFVLLLLAWPVGALARWWLGVRRSADPAGRRHLGFLRLAALGVVIAMVGLTAMLARLSADPALLGGPVWPILALQGLLAVTLAALLPATLLRLQLVYRTRQGTASIAGHALLVVAALVLSFAAVVLGLALPVAAF